MKDVYILSLHLAYGGVEKAITNMANIFVEKYNVTIINTYKMPNTPAYPLDSRVHIEYLLKDIPNRDEFQEALHKKQPFRIVKEGIKSTKILYQKKAVLKKRLSTIKNSIIISTRNEMSVLLSACADTSNYLIAQLHHDHNFEEPFLTDFQKHYQNIDEFILLNAQMCAEVQEIMKSNTHTTCSWIPNFIEHIPEAIAYEQKDKTLVAIGRLVNVKGFDRLLRMMKEIIKVHPDWKLQIIGDGKERISLEKQIQELQLQQHVELLGMRNSDEIETYLKAASLYLMTSYNEGFAIVLVEAMSCMVPSVAFDVRVGPASIIDQDVNGILVSDKDEQRFVNEVCALIEDGEKRKQMSMNAYKKAHVFSKENVRELWFEALQKGESNEETV